MRTDQFTTKAKFIVGLINAQDTSGNPGGTEAMGNISVDLMPWCINYWALVYASVAQRLISSPVNFKGLEVSHL